MSRRVRTGGAEGATTDMQTPSPRQAQVSSRQAAIEETQDHLQDFSPKNSDHGSRGVGCGWLVENRRDMFSLEGIAFCIVGLLAGSERALSDRTPETCCDFHSVL